jgi:hypothetical protein
VADAYSGNQPGLTSPATRAVAVVPSDATILDPKPRALYVGGAGDVVIDTEQDTGVTLSAVPAGSVIPIRAKRVKAATTATLIVALS